MKTNLKRQFTLSYTMKYVYLFIVHRPIFLQQMRHKEIVHMSRSEKKNQKNPSLDVTLWNTVGFWALCVYLSDYCLYNKTSKNKRLICTAEVVFLRCFTSWCTGNLKINIHHVLISLFLCQVQKHLELSLFCFSAVTCGFVWFHFSLYSPTKTSSYARLLSSFKLWCVEEIHSWCVAGK